MFVRRSMGQYEEGDYVSSDYVSPNTYDWSSLGLSWGVTPEQQAIAEAPVSGISTQPVVAAPSGGGGGGWLASLLSPLIGGAAQVGSAYLQTQKPTGATILTSGGAATPVTVPATQQAGLFSGSMLPILGIIGIGAFLVLRGKKGKK